MSEEDTHKKKGNDNTGDIPKDEGHLFTTGINDSITGEDHTEELETCLPDRQALNLPAEQAGYKLETKEMEVHHHPQLEHKSKPWKEYILEYIMIVLAVTTGFFAESLREHLGDNERKNEYLRSLVAELKYDTAQYNLVLNNIVYIRPILDSMYLNATEAARFSYTLQARWNTAVNETHFYYTPALPAIEQLKSSGSLRLINAKNVAQQILEYDTYVQVSLAPHSAEVTIGADKVYNLEDAMCDEKDFSNKLDENMANEVTRADVSKSALYNMPLVVKDATRLNELANSFVNYKARMYGYYAVTNVALQKATTLIELIKKEYGLDDAE